MHLTKILNDQYFGFLSTESGRESGRQRKSWCIWTRFQRWVNKQKPPRLPHQLLSKLSKASLMQIMMTLLISVAYWWQKIHTDRRTFWQTRQHPPRWTNYHTNTLVIDIHAGDRYGWLNKFKLHSWHSQKIWRPSTCFVSEALASFK